MCRFRSALSLHFRISKLSSRYYGLSHSNEQSPPDWEEEGFSNRFNMILTVCSPNALKLIVSKWQTNFVNNQQWSIHC
ncbi:MAG: hypothetical protein ACTS5P_00920 [Candidatus Hodgkinia cicadicola]